MVGDIEPWEKVLGKERVNGIGPTLLGLATRIYSLPEQSEEFIRLSRKKWD